MRTKLSAATLLALGLPFIAGHAVAGTVNGFGVGTSATTGVYHGIYGGIASNASAYRMGRDSSFNLTSLSDTVPVNEESCSARLQLSPQDICAAAQSGTAASDYDQTYSKSATSLTFAFADEAVPRSAAANAYADLSTGKLGASGKADYFETGLAMAAYTDTLTFTVAGATASTVTPILVQMVLHGTFDPGHSGSSVQNSLQFGTAGARVSYSGSHDGSTLTLLPSASHGGWARASWDKTTPELSVFNGEYWLTGASTTLGIYNVLGLQAGSQGLMDYDDTSALSFILPSGVSYTSASGTFLSATVGTGGGTGGGTAVPEPGSWALLLTGLAAMGAKARRKPATS